MAHGTVTVPVPRAVELPQHAVAEPPIIRRLRPGAGALTTTARRLETSGTAAAPGRAISRRTASAPDHQSPGWRRPREGSLLTELHEHGARPRAVREKMPA
jgi:hypothetical protein